MQFHSYGAAGRWLNLAAGLALAGVKAPAGQPFWLAVTLAGFVLLCRLKDRPRNGRGRWISAGLYCGAAASAVLLCGLGLGADLPLWLTGIIDNPPAAALALLGGLLWMAGALAAAWLAADELARAGAFSGETAFLSWAVTGMTALQAAALLWSMFPGDGAASWHTLLGLVSIPRFRLSGLDFWLCGWAGLLRGLFALGLVYELTRQMLRRGNPEGN